MISNSEKHCTESKTGWGKLGVTVGVGRAPLHRDKQCLSGGKSLTESKSQLKGFIH